jgi:1D-myo-inositol-tetrakisphosphate 5-kinase/inositol-polyphosphate multikinase
MGEREPCGRLKPEELAGAFARFTSSSTTTTSQDPDQSTPIASHATNLLRILRALKSTLESLHAVLQHLEIRFIGASLLVVYEGDPQRLVDAWGAVDAGSGKGDGLDDEAEVVHGDDEDEESEDDEDPTTTPHKPRSFLSGVFNQFGTENPAATGFGLLDSSPPSSPEPNERFPDADASDREARPFSVRLIDFAHTRLVDGEGPDEGVLMGMRTVLGLVEGRIRELEEV